MRGVARRGGIIGGYVWDFAADISPTWPFRHGLRELGVRSHRRRARKTPVLPG